MMYQKFYKQDLTSINNMFPGDLQGLPDDFFLTNYLILRGDLI